MASVAMSFILIIADFTTIDWAITQRIVKRQNHLFIEAPYLS